MARRLILMRHAKSDWADHSLSDHDRPLNERGRVSAPLMAKHLANNNLAPQAIIASTATRVRETLALMLPEWRHEPEVEFCELLYLASIATLRAEVRGFRDSWSDAMLIGHNPGLTDFVSWLADRPMEMPTAAVAVFVSSQSSWSDAIAAQDWELSAEWRPRELFG